MRFLRILVAVGLLGSLTGCGLIHFGRRPPAATATGDAGRSEAFSDLATEQKILKQELAIVRRESDALRAALDRGPGAASPELLAQLTAANRELTTLRASYAKLQAGAAGGRDPATAARLAELEEKLAGSLRNYTQLREENARLRSDIDRAQRENFTLTTQLKAAANQNDQAQAALSQLNSELLAEKEARARAEQAIAATRAQLGVVLASREPVTPATGDSTSTASSALALAKAPPAGSSAIAELRTSSDRPGSDAGISATTDRTHVVAIGDTLEQLAVKYYGEGSLWVKIYTANNDLLRDGRALAAGMELQIPAR